MSQEVVSQIFMVLTLALMLTGKAPIYLTAFVGATISALIYGVVLIPREGEIALSTLIQSGLHSVIIDMLGVLLFIGIMERSGFLQIIIVNLMKFGKKIGQGPGVCTAGGIAAGIIGGLTGFTQPAITAVITGPAAIKLGVDPNKVAGTQALAGTLGNFGGFTHPTMVAVVATAGISFGMINVIGAIVALSIFAVSYILLQKSTKNVDTQEVDIEDIINRSIEGVQEVPLFKAIFPFIFLLVGFVLGIPIVVVGIAAGIITTLLASKSFIEGEKAMMEGLTKIITPLFATVSFLFMSAVINHIGLIGIISNVMEPFLVFAPIQIMILVAAVTAFLTQSNAASIAIIIPFLTIVIDSGANPFAAAVAAAGAPAIMQYYLTGGPVAALSTVIPVIPNTDLKTANLFQRPCLLAGLFVLIVITLFL